MLRRFRTYSLTCKVELDNIYRIEYNSPTWISIFQYYEPNNNTYFGTAIELEPISRFVEANTVSRSLIIYHDRHIQCYMR